MKNNYYDVTTGKQAELSPLQKMYLELEKIIKPRLLGDFCGYNEETQSFDIVLATKEIIEAKEQECENYKKQFKADTKEMERLEQENICSLSYSECLEERVEKLKQECEELKFTIKHTGLLDLMNKNVELKQALDEIEKICQIKEENSQFVLPSVWQQILDIINKAKEN